MAAGARKRKRQKAQSIQQQPVSEMIGRVSLFDAQVSVYRSRARVKTIDETVPDYEFWDKFRHGKAVGYSLGSLFAKRIEHLFSSWTLGRGLSVTLCEGGEPENEDDPRHYTDGLLADFIRDNHIMLIDAERDKIGLGDQYIIVNVDGTLSVPSPDTVITKRDELDYRTVESVTVETKTGRYTIRDMYTLTERIVTVLQAGRVVSTDTYQNLIGVIPIIHLAHDMSGNEVYGHPIHDELKPLYDQYDDLIYKQLDGAKLLGNPLLAFVGMEDISAVQNANQLSPADNYNDFNGNLVDRPQLKIDSNSALLVGKGGDAKFVSPPVGFTADTQQALKTLFLLLLDHTGIPEFIWGNELSGAHATTQVQMTQWVRDIEARRKHDEGWIIELCNIWLMTMALLDPQIVVDKLEADWPQLIEEDEKTRLEYVKYAHDGGLLTDKTALELLNLVDDPHEEIEDAQVEAAEKQAAMFPDGLPNAGNGQTDMMGQDATDNMAQDAQGDTNA